MKTSAELPKAHPIAVPKVPTWAWPRDTILNEVDAGYLAGAALNSLDNLVRSDPAWAGVWRQRLALKSAMAATRLLGRAEEESALRDAQLFRAPGDDPGPAGKILLAWRRLASGSMRLDDEMVRPIAEYLGVTWDDHLAEVMRNARDRVAQIRSAPVLAGELAAELYRARPNAELLAFWLADVLLAQRFRWPVAVPLLMGQVTGTTMRSGSVFRRVRPGESSWGLEVLLKYAQAAREACDLAADLAQRAARLDEVTPRLRSPAAADIVKLLLDDDAVPASGRVSKKLTARSARRLFERLIELGVVRELTGRPTFRLYGI